VPEELDGAHGRQRQPVDGQVEEAVHRGQGDPEGQQHPPLTVAEPGDQAPGAPPQREHDGGAGDAQPGHPEHRDVREQQHREGRPEVVEDRADQEERHGGSLVTAGAARSAMVQCCTASTPCSMAP
jgi:hypothetical protein